MEMHQLRYVVAVARTGNFSRAAEQCRVAQPSLSQQILKLEDELGERLFDRRHREVRLTVHGEAFLGRAVRILEEVEAARREASDAQQLLRGTIRLGVLPTLAPYLLPQTLAEFTEEFPGIEWVVNEDTTERLVQLALAHELDFALASLPIRNDRLELKLLFTEELLLALPSDHPLARRRAVNAADLEDQRLIVMKEGHCLGDQVLAFCERQDARVQIRFRSAQLETVQALVASGLGISLVPQLAAVRNGETGPEYRPFRSPKPRREIVALWPRQRPPGRAAAIFLERLAVRFRSAKP
ncbi:MAG: LysR family transcriptional regulator [Verrucomicrobiae bacterium]|nr:LysR family transcriptional regulator [Verrucomicrobiae bacterium]